MEPLCRLNVKKVCNTNSCNFYRHGYIEQLFEFQFHFNMFLDVHTSVFVPVVSSGQCLWAKKYLRIGFVK